ncbi:MAG: DUF4102 domain-containing protein [Burkholderiales bacterium]|nr:DUF4102 domain-containing protein [Burkholderiales bacterium]
MQLRIAVDGIKTWLVRYMFDGKERQYRLPELYGDGDGRIGLKEAREEATHVRALARKGIDIQIKLDNERQAEVERQEVEVAQSKTLTDLFEDGSRPLTERTTAKNYVARLPVTYFPIAGDLKLSSVHQSTLRKF